MTNAAKWKPGPWHAEQNLRADGVGIGGFQVLCEADESDDNNFVAETFAKGNASLIAAAPDLYEIVSAFMEDRRFQVGVGGNPNVVDALLARAHAALAKARGEL